MKRTGMLNHGFRVYDETQIFSVFNCEGIKKRRHTVLVV